MLLFIFTLLLFMLSEGIWLNRKMDIILENQKTMFSIMHRVDNTVDDIQNK